MKKYYILSIIFLLIIVGCIVIYNNLSTEKSETFTVYEDNVEYFSKYGRIAKVNWESVNLENSGFENVEDFLLDIDYYVDAISQYVGKPDWKETYREKRGDDFKFKIGISFIDGGSHVLGGYNHYKHLRLGFKLSRSFFECNRAPIAHEITHLIVPYYSSLSLREGLASYIQDTIGKNPSLFNQGKPIIPLSKEFLLEENIENSMDVIMNIGTEGIPKGINITASDIETRKKFYFLSYSFSKYLIDEYGIEKFMEIYEAKDLNTKYEELYEKSLEELKNDWINYVRAYEDN